MNFDFVYSQPDFYHFSQSSVELAKYAFKNEPQKKKVCDLFAGCGVVGREYAELSKNFTEITFIELQQSFMDHLRVNSEHLKRAHLINDDFRNVKSLAFDLILANPPFFEIGKARPSPDAQKNVCQMRDYQWDEIIEWCKASLELGGSLFLLLPTIEEDRVQKASRNNFKLKSVSQLSSKELIFHMFLDIK